MINREKYKEVFLSKVMQLGLAMEIAGVDQKNFSKKGSLSGIVYFLKRGLKVPGRWKL